MEGKEKGGFGNWAPSWVGGTSLWGPIQSEDSDEDGSLRDGVEVPGPWGSGEGSGLDLSRGRERVARIKSQNSTSKWQIPEDQKGY